jgi:hypothetical protein
MKSIAAALQHSRFQVALSACAAELSDLRLRRFVFDYCEKYQEAYWFDQLTNAFAYLEITLRHDAELLADELPLVRAQIEEAIGEYFESLNEVAMAIFRLIDEKPLTGSDVSEAITHVWCAHSCNELAEEFVEREDRILCEMISSLTCGD